MEKSDNRRKADALRLASESRSTQAPVRVLTIDPKLRYKWQQDLLPTLPADPSEAVEVRQLRAANQRLVQGLELLKSQRHLQGPAHLVSRYRSIDQQQASYSMRLLCQVLDVTPSRYDAWGVRVAKVPMPVALITAGVGPVQTFTYHKQRYGTRRLIFNKTQS
jgi:transposase